MKRQQDPEFIQQTIDVWQPCSKEKLTEADAIEIITNMTGLLKVLMKIDARLKAVGSEGVKQ